MRGTPIFIGIILVILAWVLWLWLGKRMVRPHRTAILATAIPPTLLAIAAVVYVVYTLLNIEGLRKVEGYTIADICWLVGYYLVAAAILPSVVFAIMRKWEIAKGIGFGSGIGLVVLLIAFVLAGIVS